MVTKTSQMALLKSPLFVCTALLYVSCYGQNLQILNVTPSETEVFLEWSLNLLPTVNNFGFNLALAYGGPCPNVSFISVETVPSTASSYTFTGLEAFSTYTVAIEPLLEGLEESLQETIMFQTLPSAPELPPQNLRPARATPTLLTIEWNPVPCLQQNALITSYLVEFEGESTNNSSFVSASEALTFTATNLRTITNYTLRVYPVTSQFGQSELFASLNLTTLEGVRIAQIVPQLNGREILVNWTYPREAEDTITSFEVLTRYLRPCFNIGSFTSIIRNGSRRSQLLNDLLPGSEYLISVTAEASEGTTVSVSIEVGTIPLEPPPPNNFQASTVGITTITLQWEPVPCDERNILSPLAYYVRLMRESQPGGEEQIFLSFDSTRIVLSDLEPDTGYVAFVHTLPSGGSFMDPHGTSQPLRVRTQPDLSISADRINENGFRVNWIYPSDLTSLEGFDVRLDYLGACEALLAVPLFNNRLPPEARSFTFSELQERSLYNVTVTAVNPSEFREASMAVITNAESQAITPLNVSVTDVTTSSITVEFIPSVACNYTIDFGESGGSRFVVGRLITNNTYTVTGLDEDSSYFFEIVPVVDSAFGLMAQRSTAIHVQTFTAIPVSLVSAEPTSLLLQWTLPVLEINQMIRARSQTVSIFYEGPCELDEVVQPSQVMVVGEEVRMIRLENLEELSDYSVMVTAEYPNEILSGSVISTTQPAVPASPPASVTIERTTNTTITVSWEPVPCLDRNSRIAGYIVEYGPTASYPETQSPVLQDLTFTIQDRQPNTSYTFQVYPVPEFGQGLDDLPVPKTLPVTVRTRHKPPTQLMSDTGTSQGSSMDTGLLAGVVVLVILLAAVALVGIILLIRTIAIAKREKMHKESPASVELVNCIAYTPTNLKVTSPKDIRPSDLALEQLPMSPRSHMVPPPPPLRRLPLPPPVQYIHETSPTNSYETIPYSMHKDVLPDVLSYSKLSRYQVANQQGRATEKYDKVNLEEVPERSCGVTETTESYDDVI